MITFVPWGEGHRHCGDAGLTCRDAVSAVRTKLVAYIRAKDDCKYPGGNVRRGDVEVQKQSGSIEDLSSPKELPCQWWADGIA